MLFFPCVVFRRGLTLVFPLFFLDFFYIFTTITVFVDEQTDGKQKILLILKHIFMSLNCLCPLPAALSDIPTDDCPTNFGQIQKIAIQRKGLGFDGLAGNDILLLADWQTRTAAIDDTKIIVSPFVYEATITAGEAITNGGGDNSTLNGETELVGVNVSTFEGMFKESSAEVIAALQALRCERNLVVYLFTEFKKIIALEITDPAYQGIGATSFFVGDKSNTGFASKDSAAVTFNIPCNWSASAKILTPTDFDPLTDL